jgi:hypothetical protein
LPGCNYYKTPFLWARISEYATCAARQLSGMHNTSACRRFDFYRAAPLRELYARRQERDFHSAKLLIFTLRSGTDVKTLVTERRGEAKDGIENDCLWFWSELASETSLFPRGESQRDSALSGSPLVQLKLCTAHLPRFAIYDCIASQTQSLLKYVSFPLYFDSSSVLCTYFAEIKSGDTSKSCIFNQENEAVISDLNSGVFGTFNDKKAGFPKKSLPLD